MPQYNAIVLITENLQCELSTICLTTTFDFYLQFIDLLYLLSTLSLIMIFVIL